MLTHLTIRDVVLIDHLDLEFMPGLSVLTGETGAGKSILLDSLGLATGARAEARLVRHGSSQATVTATFELPDGHGVLEVLARHDLHLNGEPLILRRNLGADGRSRAFINDQPISVGLLKEVGDALVEVHGQFDNQRLLQPDAHRGLLDAFAGHDGLVAKTQSAFEAWRVAADRREQAELNAETARRDEDFIRHAVAELDTMDPKPDEEATLARQRQMMMHGEQLMEALGEAIEQASGNKAAEDCLRNTARALERVAEKAEGRLDKAIAAIDRALDDLAEGISEINRLTNDLDLDPARQEEIEERLFSLRALARKHNVRVDDLSALRERMREQLNAIEDGSSTLQALRDAEKAARKAFLAVATSLSKSRREAAARLDKKVASELSGLHLDKARFVTEVTELTEVDWRNAGIDRIRFLVATNPGVPPGPLSRIASGGEAARFMLALKVVLAEADPVETMVFDEVDAGVGGAVAEAVGERLARLGGIGQVLAVTHSPQVAARGANHWRVSKAASANDETDTLVWTTVEPLDAAARKEEIARMLAGRRITDEARAAADSLLGGGVS